MSAENATENVQTFNSEVDWWIGALLAILPLVPAAILLAMIIQGARDQIWIGWLTLLGSGLFYALILIPLRYRLDSKKLHVNAGLLIRWSCELKDIKSVEPSRNPISSPALSLNRLRVELTNGRWVLISPSPRAAFFDALAERCPHLQRDGESLK